MPSRPIRDVIQDRKFVTVAPGSSVREAVRSMATHKVDAVLVVESKRLVGIFTENDAVRRVLATGADPDHTTIAKAMTKRPITATSDRPLAYALHLMFDGGFHHVPIVDDERVVGVVLARDALGSDLTRFEGELEQRAEIAAHMR